RKIRERANERVQLRGEREAAAGEGPVEERLLPRAVAREEQAPLLGVPQREREHARELGDAVGAVILVQLENYLAVAPRSKHVPSLHEAGPELGEVVDLTVDDDPDGLVFIEERLGAFGRQVDD